jgi:hypothetical protein
MSIKSFTIDHFVEITLCAHRLLALGFIVAMDSNRHVYRAEGKITICSIGRSSFLSTKYRWTV